MLRSVTVTQHCNVERWDHWIVAVPDDMDDERIQELMRELWENGDLELGEVEYPDDQNSDEPDVDITDAPVAATPHLTLTANGLVDEAAVLAALTTKRLLAALTTKRLQTELERRKAKESGFIVE